MIGYTSIVVLATIFQIISTGEPNISAQCRIHPSALPKKPHECCKIPPLFTEEELESCGFKKLEEGAHRGPHVPPHDCTKQICLLNKHNIVDEKGEINIEGATQHLDTWTEANPDFAAASEVVKQKCAVKDLPGPPHFCDAEKLMFCVTHHMISECPKWEEDEACQKVKDFVINCRPQ